MQTNHLHRLLTILCNKHFIPAHGQISPQEALDRCLIINDQHALTSCFHSASPSVDTRVRCNEYAFSPGTSRLPAANLSCPFAELVLRSIGSIKTKHVPA